MIYNRLELAGVLVSYGIITEDSHYDKDVRGGDTINIFAIDTTEWRPITLFAMFYTSHSKGSVFLVKDLKYYTDSECMLFSDSVARDSKWEVFKESKRDTLRSIFREWVSKDYHNELREDNWEYYLTPIYLKEIIYPRPMSPDSMRSFKYGPGHHRFLKKRECMEEFEDTLMELIKKVDGI